MARNDYCAIGLTTAEALVRLASAIKTELDKCQCTRSFTRGLRTWVRDAYHHNSPHSMFCWTSIVILSLEILFLLLFHLYDDKKSKSPEIEIFLLFLFLLVNVCLVGWDSMLRHAEMHSRCCTLLQSVKECQMIPPWDIEQYSNLHTPQSPCISVQWTYRDNQLVNLPCHLLVEGDIILLRPGHVSPGECKSVDKHLDPPLRLCKGTVFAPMDEHSKKGFSSPRLRKPSEPSKFVMLETPYQENLRLALQNSLKRPATLFSKECHTIVSLEHIVIPSIMMMILCIGILRAAYLNPVSSEWTEHILLRPALVVLPLLPLTLPTCWIVLNAYGMAYLLTVVDLSKQAGVSSNGVEGTDWEPDEIQTCVMSHFKALLMGSNMRSVDPFEEMEEINSRVLAKPVRWIEIKDNFMALLFSQNGQLWRSANILQVLGSLTALCCVDKKGILSWPNPTAEKVFFLKSSKSKANSEDSSNLLSNSAESIRKADSVPNLREDDLVVKKSTKLNRRKDTKDHMYHPGSQVEVLDLTHNVNSPFGIQFDDPNWKSYIGNLKPLGLAILCNTCNPAAQQHYSKFCDHIACESLYNDAAVPVVNKRCLCELAKQIGFTSSVMDFYALQQQIGVFRHVRPEVIQKGRLARSLNFPRLKMPFPNISCAVVKDLHRGSFQMFSQGTADLILDACNEYWDGEDISLLTESDRKRILDFYHRSSLTAHCMGYAYSPLNNVPSSKLAATYIELPPDSSHIFPSVKNINSSVRSWNHLSMEGHPGNIMNRYLSSDSLLLQEQDEINHNAVLSTNACLQQLGNEIFIGMVTMQYQACPDFVQLIEQLDKACIRFVHFSKENELRSRVFSEKMGLESGWNCHISLLSEKNGYDGFYLKSKAVCETPLRKSSVMHHSGVCVDSHQRNHQIPLRCVSAPSVVNLDMTVVKFEDEISVHSKTDSFSDLLPMSADNVHEDEIGLGRNVTGFQQRTASSVEEILMMDDSNLSHSPSRITESTDQSAPVTFDMSNRAKLPKGTENIRPHIENVDNVPLQVSLFTDCTPEATREMICIMQEYGEVVCCLGSSANCQNMPIFLQADVSIAVEPLYPQLCMQQPVFGTPVKKRGIGPAELSSVLNSLPCALSFHREDPVNLHHLIMEARHFLISMRNSFQFMLCCCMSITLLQILSVIFIQPLIFTPGHVLWLVCLEIPLLSLSLLGNTMDSEVTTLATGKNTKVLSKQAMIFFMACFGAKFCPSVVVALSCFALIMADFCHKNQGKIPDQCWMFLDIREANETVATRAAWSSGLSVGQNVTACLTVIYLVFISVGFIRRSDLLWKTSLLTNKHWLLAAPTVIFLQLIFSIADVTLSANGAAGSSEFFQSIPYYIWLIGLLWPLLLIPLNEVAKKHEIKVNVRQQKKARLEFGTKLGMNSPF